MAEAERHPSFDRAVQLALREIRLTSTLSSTSSTEPTPTYSMTSTMASPIHCVSWNIIIQPKILILGTYTLSKYPSKKANWCHNISWYIIIYLLKMSTIHGLLSGFKVPDGWQQLIFSKVQMCMVVITYTGQFIAYCSFF